MGRKRGKEEPEPVDPSAAARELGRRGGLRGGKVRAERMAKLTPEERAEWGRRMKRGAIPTRSEAWAGLGAALAKLREGLELGRAQAELLEHVCSAEGFFRDLRPADL